MNINMFISLILVTGILNTTGTPEKAETTNKDNYLFSSFRGNGEDGLHLAYSHDGLKWIALNNDKSFLKPEVGTELMRDPCICRGPDDIFHIVWTSGWWDKGIGIAHSKDLINWSVQPCIGADFA